MATETPKGGADETPEPDGSHVFLLTDLETGVERLVRQSSEEGARSVFVVFQKPLNPAEEATYRERFYLLEGSYGDSAYLFKPDVRGSSYSGERLTVKFHSGRKDLAVLGVSEKKYREFLLFVLGFGG